MKNKIKIFLVIPVLFVFQLQISAQTPDFSGNWILNLEKSEFEQWPTGMTGSVFIIKQAGKKFSLTINHLFGDRKKKISFKMIADGKTRRIKILFKGKLEQKETNLQVILWRKNFLNIVNYKFGNSQNEFIADEIYTGKPQNHHNIWVFDRAIPK